MELLLELRDAARGTASATDVRVDVDPDDTVAALTEALSDHLHRTGGTPRLARPALSRPGAARPFEPTARIVDTDLVSGEAVVLDEGLAGLSRLTPDAADGPLGQATPDDLRSTGGLTLDVTAGPAVGRVIPLARDVTVGRADSCSVVIDDPTMSREHFALQVRDDRIFVVPNPEATNGTVVGGEELEERAELRLVEPILAGSSVFAVRRAVPEETRRRDRLGQVPFNRVPYRRTVVRSQDLDEMEPPPETPNASKLSIATALMPAASAAGMAMMFDRYLFLLLAAASPALLVVRHFTSKRGGKRRFRRERAAFEARVEEAVVRVDEALARERKVRLTAAPDLAELARQAMLHMPRLWERDRLAGDLLDVRLGLGEAASEVHLVLGRGGDAALRAAGEDRLAYQGTVTEVPVTVRLLDVGTMGLWGDAAQVAAAGRALISQVACLHSPEDLVMAVAVGRDQLAGFEWAKWLPHVRSATSPLEGAHLAVGPEATQRLLVNLLAVAADRGERSQHRDRQVWPRLLVVLDEGAEPDRALLSQLLDVAPEHGIHVVWLGESELQVPRQCRVVVACPGRGTAGRVRFTDPALDDRAVDLDGAGPETARSIARALAPLRDASAASQTTAIPRMVPLFDVVPVDEPSPDAVVRRWRQDRPYGLTFPVGMSADGVLDLDLVEQGPHTLIGGTSGAGKSELLQTLVLSLAVSYPPNRLNFLFVDYKGGASSAEFRELPHTVGYVTNLSGRMSLRALTSLRAELQRRMALLEGRTKDLREMLSVDPAAAPPSLVIVVDEFATLVKEIPDFVAGIVDIAQRGRSLGVHLILATQRPTGIVDQNILANANLRISLRMLDAADSTNVIGTRDAADIPVPLRGRAYARTGPRAPVPFQCAWSGAPVSTGEQVRDVGVQPFAFAPGAAAAGDIHSAAGAGVGDDVPVDDGRATGARGDEPPTQLEHLVDVCAAAARSMELPPVRRPWVEPLGEVVALDAVTDRLAVGEHERDPGRFAVLGLYDDPANQAQHVATVDLEASGGLIAFGTGGSGKTTLLRTLAVGLARQGGPDEVQLYALDFASRSLDPLADLPHCSAVVPGDDVERTTRLLTVLEQEVERRREVLARARAENLGALRVQTGSPVVPRVVVLLDGYQGFHSTFDRSDRFAWLARLQRIVSAGRQVGVHCVITADRRFGVPSALLSAIAARLVLRMATTEEVAALGVPLKVARDAELPAGRGFLDGEIEVQVACVDHDPSGVAQSEAVAAAAAELAVPGAGAPALPELPSSLVVGTPDEQAPLTAELGVADLTLQPAVADLSRRSMVVVGGPLSGRSTTLETLALGLRASTGPDVALCALGSAVSPLQELDVWDDAAFARTEHADVVERVSELLDGDGRAGAGVRAVLFVDAAEDVEASDATRGLEALTRSDAVRLVVACEAGTVTRAYSGWLSALRRNRSAVMLQPDSKAEVEATVGVKPDFRPDQEFPPGRGLFVADRRWQLIQVGRVGLASRGDRAERRLRSIG
jgi:DNA segregation ATPase FtsK/SpoIIIE, S-DNA-T family